MEVSKGFIVGVFNYCDRWCERCPFTSRCRVFADEVEDEFEQDHGAIGEPREERMAREMGEAAERWEKELGIDFNQIYREAEEAAKNLPDDDSMFEVSLEHLEIETRTKDFTDAVYQWVKDLPDEEYRASMALQVMGRFWIFVSGKVHRALMGLKDAAENDLDDGADARGSAKAALLALEEMRSACDAVTREGRMATDTRNNLVGRIDWLVDALERTLPDVRAFVRPGFDEPEALAELEAAERG